MILYSLTHQSKHSYLFYADPATVNELGEGEIAARLGVDWTLNEPPLLVATVVNCRNHAGQLDGVFETLQNAGVHIPTIELNIAHGTYVSVWDGGVKVESPCTVHFSSRVVEIHGVEDVEVNVLENEYVVVNGHQYHADQENNRDTYTPEQQEKMFFWQT